MEVFAMWNSATYQPDPYVTAGSNWAKRRGIPNWNISVHRVGDHAHVFNLMGGMTNLVAVIVDGGPAYAAKVVPTGRCETCQPTTYTMSFEHPSGAPGSASTTDRSSLNQMARNAIQLGLRNIEVRDDTGRDVTFEIPEFCEQ